MNANGNEMLKHALAYASLGWHVIPLRPRRKTPITSHGEKDATTNPAQIREWWGKWPGANIGIATGPSGLLAIDIDPRHGGMNSINALAEQYGRPITNIVAMTDGGGRHFYYRRPVDVKSRANAFGLAWPGIDTRGSTGYVVAPPSIHPGGKAYKWILPGPLAPDAIPQLPAPPNAYLDLLAAA